MQSGPFSEEEIRDAAGGFLLFLKQEEIQDIRHLEERLEETFPVHLKVGHFINIEVSPAPDPFGVAVYNLIYMVKNRGIPVEAKLVTGENRTPYYTEIIVRGKINLEDYTELEGFKGLVRYKRFEGCSLDYLRTELEFMSNPEKYKEKENL